jgi:parallel beta-helix repeat protein
VSKWYNNIIVVSVFNPVSQTTGNYATVSYVNATFLKQHYPNVDTPMTFISGGSIVMNQSNNLAAVTVKAPSTGITSYTLTLPVNSGGSGQILTTDGSGNTSWSANSISGSVTAGANIIVSDVSNVINVATTLTPTFTTITSNSLICNGVYTINSSMTAAQINSAIANTAYTYYAFGPGTYNLTLYILISRNNVVLDGQNSAILTLASAANVPNILIGDITGSTPVTFYSDIKIQNFVINGNKTHQSSQYPSGLPGWVVNNCISVGYSSVVIDNCDLQSAISGGLTFTQQCNNCTITNSRSSNHTYDSFTSYGSKNLQFTNNYSTGNSNGAGISIDTGCQYVTISNNCFTNNKLAIFTRWGSDFSLTGNIFSGNAQQGIFIAGNYDSSNIGPNVRFTITGNTISNNGLQGIYLQSCQYFTVANNTICNNSGNGINIVCDNATHGLCSYNNFSGNVSSANTGTGTVGFYNDSSNSYTAGARSNYLSLNIIKNNTSGQVSGDLTAYTWDDDTQINTGQLTIHNNSGNYAQLNSSGSGNSIFTFPSTTGSNGNLLQTDGAGNSSWATYLSATTVNLLNNGGVNPFMSLTNTNGSTTLSNSAVGSYTTNFVLPNSNGTNGYLLQTDGTGKTSWVAASSSYPPTITPRYQLGDNSGYVIFPYTYSAGSNLTVLQVTMTFPAGYTYRINCSWNLSISNTSGSTQTYLGYVSDGTNSWAYSNTSIPYPSTQTMSCTGVSYYSTYTNTTATISLIFGSSGGCTLNQQNAVGTLPMNCAYLICNAVM